MDMFAWKEKIMSTSTVIDNNAANTELQILLDKYDWFVESIVEGKAICVYVSHMSEVILKIIPEVLYGHQVKVAFHSYLTCGEKFAAKMPISNNSFEEEFDCYG
jgi:hypothetical protein